jgi:hypothetical protein
MERGLYQLLYQRFLPIGTNLLTQHSLYQTTRWFLTSLRTYLGPGDSSEPLYPTSQRLSKHWTMLSTPLLTMRANYKRRRLKYQIAMLSLLRRTLDIPLKDKSLVRDGVRMEVIGIGATQNGVKGGKFKSLIRDKTRHSAGTVSNQGISRMSAEPRNWLRRPEKRDNHLVPLRTM